MCGFDCMEITACPQCKTKHITKEMKRKETNTQNSIEYKCKICGYKGSPLLLEQYEGLFQGIKPSNHQFIGPWEIHTRLDTGQNKILYVLWEDARDCVHSLQLKQGDRITVTVDEKIWCIEKE